MAEGEAGEVVYLSVTEVIAIHAEAVGGGEANAAKRVLKPDGLDSAVARPLHYAHYDGADLALQAAVLAHGIAEGQIFIEGNKRTGLLAMLTFLVVNGFDVTAPDEDLATWMLDLAGGGSAEELAARGRKSLTPL